MRERNPPLWMFIAVVVLSGLTIHFADTPPPKVYKNGYEVVKIGNCEYRFAAMPSWAIKRTNLNNR